MLRSKTRSGSVDITQKNNNSSLFSRTFSASKLCRGDVIGTQTDPNALRPIDKKPSQVSNLSKNQADRAMATQQQMGDMEEELRMTKEKLNVSEIEKHQIIDQLKEIESLKKSLSSKMDEFRSKDKKIDSLESELGRARQLEAEKNASFDKLNNELRDLKDKENETKALLLENKKRIQELEDEVDRRKELESKTADSLAFQTKQLETTKFEIVSLHEKIESLEEKLLTQDSSAISSKESVIFSEEEINRLKSELESAQQGEKNASSRVKSLLSEMEVLRNEWRLAIEAEEKSTKAMEDLALALKEVATESNQAKEKLNSTQTELQHVRGEAEKLKNMVRNTEETYKNLLNEAKQESEKHKNTVDRLRLEAEETLLALSAKEMGFVSCIKQAEEEKATAQCQNAKLSENLKAAENMTRAAREETYKLRDILKQAVNEANAAKAAAGIARDENSLLKDLISDKDERLHFLTRENERLRMCEAAANENVKQLKILLSRSSLTDLKSEEYKECLDDVDEDDNDDDDDDVNDDSKDENKTKMSNHNKSFSFCLEDLKFMNESEEKVLDEDPVKAEALRGSIFDSNAETPKSEPRTPKTALSARRYLEDGKVGRKSEDLDQLSDSDCSERGSHRRTKTMFQRVGDLLAIRRSYHKKEAAPVEQQEVSANAALS
ncbi:hypothetical protein CASFOL_023497 [Castilleja foliolosa]|uniref:Uncharacterized protein n=1 Tax=Castilleja foliolosa TaxID=1961234 RepID=A0ABD3CLK9_9LAMI